MLYLRSLVYTTLLFASVLVYASLVLIVAPFGYRARYRVALQFANLNAWLLATICNLRHTVVGTDNIPAKNCVVYLKHSSVWETLEELRVFPPQCWVLKRELHWIPIFGWALALLKPIAINRNGRRTAVRQVVHQGKKRLDEGLWVMIFPEGTRVAPGATRQFGVSGALLAVESGRQIVPVAHNAGDFWPRRSLLKRPGLITLVIGPAIDTTGKRPGEVNREAQDWIESTMREISVAYADTSGQKASEAV